MKLKSTNSCDEPRSILVEYPEYILELRFGGDKGVLLEGHHPDKLTDIYYTIVVNIYLGYHLLRCEELC